MHNGGSNDRGEHLLIKSVWKFTSKNQNKLVQILLHENRLSSSVLLIQFIILFIFEKNIETVMYIDLEHTVLMHSAFFFF